MDFNLVHRPGWQGRIEAITRPGVLPFAAGALTGIFARIDGLAVEGATKDGQRFTATLQNGDFLALRPETVVPGALTLAASAAAAGKVLGILAVAERLAVK